MKKIFTSLLITTVILNTVSVLPAFAADSSTVGTANAGNKFNLSIDDAVKLGLQNSIILKQVQNQIDLAAVTNDKAQFEGKRLHSAQSTIDKGKSELAEKEELYNTSEKNLTDAYDAIDKQSIAPMDITYTDASGNTVTISKGTKIDPNMGKYIEQNYLDPQKTLLAQSKAQLDAGEQALEDGEVSLDEALTQAGTSLSDQLNLDSAVSLTVDSSKDLMTTMADVQYQVTKSSYDIYKNQLAMLIQKSYYDVLEAQKLLEVKKKAMDRGEKQYQFAKDSYEGGLKAKDDMLLANTYYKGTQLEYQKAVGDLNNTLTELKKNLNIPLGAEVTLKDVMADKVEEEKLDDGLQSGLKNRLEIKQALGQVVVYDLNLETTSQKYPDNTFQYKEASLRKDKARINFDKTKVDVESSIRESYETLTSTGKMLNTSKEMVEQCNESVEIAEYKYKEGFGTDNSLLKKLNIEEASGTIVEVLAAEENLSEVEEKAVEIMYGYNLAKMKYYNDIGKFVY